MEVTKYCKFLLQFLYVNEHQETSKIYGVTSMRTSCFCQWNVRPQLQHMTQDCCKIASSTYLSTKPLFIRNHTKYHKIKQKQLLKFY